MPIFWAIKFPLSLRFNDQYICFSWLRSRVEGHLKSAELNFIAWGIDTTNFSTKHSNHKHVVEELGQHSLWCPQFGTVSFWILEIYVQHPPSLRTDLSTQHALAQINCSSLMGLWTRIRPVPILTTCYWHSQGGSHWELCDLGSPLEVSQLTPSRTDLLNSISCF